MPINPVTTQAAAAALKALLDALPKSQLAKLGVASKPAVWPLAGALLAGAAVGTFFNPISGAQNRKWLRARIDSLLEGIMPAEQQSGTSSSDAAGNSSADADSRISVGNSSVSAEQVAN